MPRRLRIAILGASPCGDCAANCCKQRGHDYAVLLRGDEPRRFAPFAVSVPIEQQAGPGEQGGRVVHEHVLPYAADGRCQFLGPEDRCSIYDDRPQSCRDFECVRHYNADGPGRHARFLHLNPDVLDRLERL
jgi:Fe-S-cluster containining protein